MFLAGSAINGLKCNTHIMNGENRRNASLLEIHWMVFRDFYSPGLIISLKHYSYQVTTKTFFKIISNYQHVMMKNYQIKIIKLSSLDDHFRSHNKNDVIGLNLLYIEHVPFSGWKKFYLSSTGLLFWIESKRFPGYPHGLTQ